MDRGPLSCLHLRVTMRKEVRANPCGRRSCRLRWATKLCSIDRVLEDEEMRSKTGLLFMCLALVASCGGETTTTTSDDSADISTTTAITAPVTATTTAPVQDDYGMSELVLAASDSLVAALGVDEATTAVVLALDSGYSFDQLTAAAAAGTLSTDGTISGVDPVYDTYGLIVNSSPSATDVSATGEPRAVHAILLTRALAAADSDPVPQNAFIRNLNDRANDFFSPREAERQQEERGRFVIAMLYHLSSLGYSFEQIVDGIVFGEIHWFKPTQPGADGEDVQPCIGLSRIGSDDSLVAITPASHPAKGLTKACQALSSEFDKGDDADLLVSYEKPPENWFSATVTTTTTTTEPEVVEPFPWTFSGPVTSDNTIGAPNPLEFSYTYEATITLFEDGTLEYSILLPAGRQGLTVDCTNGTSYLSTDYPEDGGSWQGEHEDGEFKVRFTDTMVREGTYTHEELHYEVLFESDFAVCDGTVGVTSMRVEEAYLPRTAP